MATFKIVDVLEILKKRSVIRKVRIVLFSVNIDECIASNTRNVLSILASYFDDEFGNCVVQGYIHVNAEVLLSKICCFFLKMTFH